MHKKYDPLWEIIDEKVALQGSEKPLEMTCPRCHVNLQLQADATPVERFCCGLCGAVFELARDSGERPLRGVEIVE